MTSVEKMLVNYNCNFNINSTLHSTMRIILQNLDKVSKMTIDELAQFCFTSPSTISRMVKTLGYKNYSSFQAALADYLGGYYFHNMAITHAPHLKLDEQLKFLFDSELELIEQVRQRLDMDLLKKLSAQLHDSEYVAVFPYADFLMEMPLQCDLMFTGICCDIILDENAQLDYAKKLPRNTTSIIVAPYCLQGVSHTTSLLELCGRNGNKTCVITSTDSVRNLDGADFLFAFDGKQSICDQFAIQSILAAIKLTYRSMFL